MQVEHFPQLFIIVDNRQLKNLNYRNQKKALKQMAAVVKAGGKDISEDGIPLFPASRFTDFFTQRVPKFSKFVNRLNQTVSRNSPLFGAVLLLLNLLFLRAAWHFSGKATDFLREQLASENYLPKLD